MQQWEYLDRPSVNQDILNDLGKAGWILCAWNNGGMVFRRPIGIDWRARCEAAEDVIRATTATEILNATFKWENIKKQQS